MTIIQKLYTKPMRMTNKQLEKLDDQMMSELELLEGDCERYSEALLKASENCKDKERAKFLYEKGKEMEDVPIRTDEIRIHYPTLTFEEWKGEAK